MKAVILCLVTLTAAQPSCAAPDMANYLAVRGWTAYDSKAKFTMPAQDIAPVMYYSKGSKVPSCGLLSGPASAPKFIDILASEPGEQYPHCPSINDAAAFKLAGKDYLVFEYTDQDNRNETYEQFFYVYKTSAGEYVADERLNEQVGTAASTGKTRKASEGIGLARKHALER